MYKDQVKYKAILPDQLPDRCSASRKYNGRAVTIEGNTVTQGPRTWAINTHMPPGIWYAEAWCPTSESPHQIFPENKLFIRYAIYDTDGGDWEKLKLLMDTTEGREVHLPEYQVCNSRTEVRTYYHNAVKQGWEGLCLRDSMFERPKTILKVKKSIRIEARVLAYTSSSNMLKSVLVGLHDKHNMYRPIGWISNMSEEVRSELYLELQKIRVFSSLRLAHDSIHASIVDAGKITVQIKAHDVAQTRRGKPIVSRVMHYQRTGDTYRCESGMTQRFGEVRLARIIHYLKDEYRGPTTTVMEWKEHADVSEENDTYIFLRTLSEKRRSVYRKKDALRGYALLQANTGEYVVTTVDFSPNRKSPLKIKAYAFDGMGAAAIYVGTWVEKNVKRGWNEVSLGEQQKEGG